MGRRFLQSSYMKLRKKDLVDAVYHIANKAEGVIAQRNLLIAENRTLKKKLSILRAKRKGVQHA